MLEPKVIDRIRESVEAELRPRDLHVHRQLRESQRLYPQAGRAMITRGEIGSTEFNVRADLIWQIIRRCFAAYQTSEADDSVVPGLCEQIRYWIAYESNLLRGLIDVPGASVHYKAAILTMITSVEPGLIKKYQNDAKFYVQELMNSPKRLEESNHISIGTNYGPLAVAAGSGAHAQVNTVDNTQLIEALTQLRADIQKSTAMPQDRLGESLGVIDDTIIAARAPNTNRFKLLGLLTGVAAAVSIMANAPEAWESVRAVASTLGFNLK